MPDDDAAVMRRFVEDLIVPEAHSATEQLRRGNNKRRMPKHVVQTGLDTPRAQCMKQDLLRVRRLVRIELVKQFVTRMRGSTSSASSSRNALSCSLLSILIPARYPCSW